METSQGSQLSSDIVQQTLKLSLEAGYLHTLSVAFRIDNMGYSQKDLDSLKEQIDKLHTDLRKIWGPMEAGVQLVLEIKDKMWHRVIDIEDLMDSDSNLDSIEGSAQYNMARGRGERERTRGNSFRGRREAGVG